MKFILEIDLDHQDAQKYGSIASILQSAASHFISDIDDWSAKPEASEGVIRALHGTPGQWRIVESNEERAARHMAEAGYIPGETYVQYVQRTHDAGQPVLSFTEWDYDQKLYAEEAGEKPDLIFIHPLTGERIEVEPDEDPLAEARTEGRYETIYASREAAERAEYRKQKSAAQALGYSDFPLFEQWKAEVEHEAEQERRIAEHEQSIGDLPLSYDNDDQP